MQKNTLKTIAALQLNTSKDILQVSLAMKELKEKNPTIKTLLIVKEEAYQKVKFLIDSFFDKIYLHHQIDGIQNENINVLINFSFSRESSIYASKIESEHYLGPYYNEKENSIEVKDYWSQYICSHVLNSSYNSFHLVDIYKSMLGLDIENIQESPPRQAIKQIIIAPFSNDKSASFKLSKWADIIWKLLNKNPKLKIILFYEQINKDTMEEFLNSPLIEGIKSNIHSVIRKDSYQEITNYFNLNTVLISSDLNLLSLASFFQVTSLTLGIGSTRAIENLTYNSSSYALHANVSCYPCFNNTNCTFSHKCHYDISSQEFSNLIHALCNENEECLEQFVSQLNSTHSFHLYQGIFPNKFFLKLNPIGNSNLSERELSNSFYRIAWTYFLTEKEEKGTIPILTKEGEDFLTKHLLVLSTLFKIYEFGKIYSQKILSEIAKDNPNISKIKELALHIDELDEMQEKIQTQFSSLSPIINFLKLMQANLHGKNIVELSQNSYLSFSSGSTLVAIIYDLIETTLKGQNQNAKDRPTTRFSSNEQAEKIH